MGLQEFTKISAVSFTSQNFNNFYCNSIRGVHDTEEIISVVVLTPQKLIVYRISRRIRSHMRSDFNSLVRGLGGVA
jgi:hypothetical protein